MTGLVSVGALSSGSITTGFTTIPVAQGGTGVTTSTGSGNNVLSANPTFTGTITAAALNISGNTAHTSTVYAQGIYDNSLRTVTTVNTTAGTGISLSSQTTTGATTAVTITNSGVTSAVAGSGISVSGATGAVTVTNTGVRSIAAGTGVSVSATTGDSCSISIGQAIGTGNSPTFAGITVPSITHSGTNGVGDIGGSGATFATVYATTFSGVSTTAKYADLAENYQADDAYLPGTVVMFGGEDEVTEATENTTAVAGIVSSNPAHLMNSELTGTNVIALALQGRVPCNVIGPVKKGDLMISAGNGYAKSTTTPQFGQIIGKALNDFTGDKGQIEVVVGRM
jgi:hypothetical protein